MGKILLVNQSTTYLFRSLCQRVATKFSDCSVELLAGSVEANDSERLPFRVIKSISFKREPGWRRLFTWGCFSCHFFVIVLLRRYSLVLVSTNPPFCPWIMGFINLVFRRPYILIQYDIYPDVLERMGILSPASPLYRLFLWLNRLSISRASATVTLSTDMKETLLRQFSETTPDISIIPNWADTITYQPIKADENDFIREHGLEGKFVVMYSGSFGATHDMESMLEAADELRCVHGIVWLFVGKGTRYPEIKSKIHKMDLGNVRLLDWQPLERVPLSLAAADCQIVTLDAAYSGISFPSKFYTSLSVGAAIMAIAPSDSDLAQVVRSEQVGCAVEAGAGKQLAAAIMELYSSPERTRVLRRNSRQLAISCYDERACTDQYMRLMSELLGASNIS